MNDPKDKDLEKSDEHSRASSGEKRSGRVAFDERGNSVWEWQLETGVYSRDVSTQKLKKLELDDLSIADTAINKRPSGLGGERKAAGGGFNPYDSSAPSSKSADPFDAARALGDRLADKPKTPDRPRTPADMRRLSEEIKKRKEQDKG